MYIYIYMYTYIYQNYEFPSLNMFSRASMGCSSLIYMRIVSRLAETKLAQNPQSTLIKIVLSTLK